MVVVGGAVLVLGAAACARGPADPVATLRDALATHGVEALDLPERDEELYALGEALFFDPILSGNRDVSCATCHEPALATVDRLSVAIGTGGVGRGIERQLAEAFLHVPRNSPDLFNRGDGGWHTFFWDGRVTSESGQLVTPAGDDLPTDVDSVQVAQALITIASPIEMRGFPGDVDINGDLNELALFAPDEWSAIWEATYARLVAIDGYVALLATAYPGEDPSDLGLQHAAEALVHYQAIAFASADSPFDEFLAGDDAALDGISLEGANLFFGSAGCAECHSGPLLTDQAFYSIAAPQVGPGRGEVAPLDAGSGAVDGSGVIAFRTPPLRNVAATPPYLHAGAYWSLEDVVRHHLDPEASLAAYDTGQLRSDVAAMHLPDVADTLIESLSGQLEPRRLDDSDVAAIVAFLESLTSPEIDRLGDLIPFSVPSGLELYTE